MTNATSGIVSADDSTIIRLVEAAAQRLIVVAPALSLRVAQAVAKRWRELGTDRVVLILDVDPEVYRLGYGELEGLTHLDQAASEIGADIRRQAGLRIGLIVSDASTLVYSPTPRLIEAGPAPAAEDAPPQPNAVLLDSLPTPVANDLGCGERGPLARTVGRGVAPTDDVETVAQDLEKNPPQVFDVARIVRVFNAAFEFVDFELKGVRIDAKKVQLPNYLSGISDEKARNQFRATFSVVPPDNELSGKHLMKQRELIARRYLRVITGYGSVVLRSEKDKFLESIERLKQAVEAFSKKVRDGLQKAMDANRESLHAAALPALQQNPPKEWIALGGEAPDKKTVAVFLDQDLRAAFGTADRLVGAMEVKLVFKGVTYELLQDERFRMIASAANPDLKRLFHEYDAAPNCKEGNRG